MVRTRLSTAGLLPWGKSAAHCFRLQWRGATSYLQMSSEKLPTDELWMEEALRQAMRAGAAGEVPVGAVVVSQGQIVGRGGNRNIQDSDPTAHAEIVALREAARAIGNHRLLNCEMYVTIEPCPMCAGALVHARLRRLIYGADDPKAGAVKSVLNVLNNPALNHILEVRAGVLAARSRALLQEFFAGKREKS